MAETGITANDNLLSTYFERRAIAVLHDSVAFYPLCDKRPLPQGNGKSMVFNGWRRLAAASGTLSEYSTSANAAVRLSSRKVSSTIASYGRSIALDDILELTSAIPVEPGALAELEQSAALTVDNAVQLAVFYNNLTMVGQISGASNHPILSAKLSSQASSFCADTGTHATATFLKFGFPVVFGTSAGRLSAIKSPSAGEASISAKLGPIAIRKAVARLRRLNVKPMANGMYAGVTHPNAISTLKSNPDWKQYVVNYEQGPREFVFKNAVVRVHGVELIESSNMPRYQGAAANGKKLNLTFICGQGALAMSELDGGVRMIIKKSGPQTTSDPYDILKTLAFKVRCAAAVTNVSCGVILITAEGKGEGVY